MKTASHSRQLVYSIMKNWTPLNWEPLPERLPSYFARVLNRWLKKRGYAVRPREWATRAEFIQRRLQKGSPFLETFFNLLQHPERFDATYALLADETSRATFDWYVQYRCTGALLGNMDIHCSAPISREEFHRAQKEKQEEANATGIPVHLLALLSLGLYSLKEHGGCVSPGDIVIDGGGFIGDTARMFQEQTGDSGKVYVFEPVTQQRAELEERLSGFGWSNVEIIPFGLWDERGQSEISMDGEGSSLVATGESEQKETIDTVSLDEFVQENNLNRVDFIKMDIEGAEQNALLGARETIERFRPKLAISIYHCGDDMFRIPEIIAGMNAEYKFFLRHYSLDWSETVLYAVPQ